MVVGRLGFVGPLLDELEIQFERAMEDVTVEDIQALAAFLGMCMVLHILIGLCKAQR